MQATSGMLDSHAATQSAEDVAEEARILDEATASRPREELTALLVGFGTGISIALVFLVYVMVAYANWFP